MPPPHLINAKELICKNTGLRDNQIEDELRYIYVFPLLFYIRYQFQTVYQTEETAYYSYNEGQCVDLSQIPDMPLSYQKEEQFSALSYGKVLSDVPDYNTFTTNLPNNCGPVAGANILGYWAKHGYPTLQYPYDQWDGWDLTTCLYQDMYTCLGFTMSNYFRSGILLHANTAHTNPYSHNPYPCHYHFSAGVSSPSFYSFCTEVDYNRPLAVLIYWQQNLLRWHWITGIGYSSYAGNQTIIVRSDWGWGYVYLNYNAPYLDNGYVNIYCFDYVYPAP